MNSLDIGNISFEDKRERVIHNLKLEWSRFDNTWEDKKEIAIASITNNNSAIAIEYEDVYGRAVITFAVEDLPTQNDIIQFKFVREDDYRVFTIKFDGQTFCIVFYNNKYIKDPYNETINGNANVPKERKIPLSNLVVIEGTPVSNASFAYIAKAGGGSVKERVQYQNMVYVLRKDKETKLKYILCKRAKVFLKDIRGKYKRVDKKI